MDSGLFNTTITGVATVDDACIAANQMVNDGIEVIELCDDFFCEEKGIRIKLIGVLFL